jgi:hypothetical protein
VSAETDLEQIRQLVGEDWPSENVVPMVAGLVVAVPLQHAAIKRYRAALTQIAAWPINPGNELLYIARKALDQ